MARNPQERAAQEAKVREREDRILDLRREGLTYRQIAGVIGMTPAGCKVAFDRAMSRQPDERILEIRETGYAQLDEIYNRMRGIMMADHMKVAGREGKVATWQHEDGVRRPVFDPDPNVNAAKVMIAAIDQRNKMAGAHAPSKRVHELVTKDAVAVAMEELNRKLSRLEDEEKRLDEIEEAALVVEGDNPVELS